MSRDEMLDRAREALAEYPNPEAALADLVAVIDSTGGTIATPEGVRPSAPVDPYFLGEIYLRACSILRIEPRHTPEAS